MATILVVDDDERLTSRMVQEFRASGHTCRAQTRAEYVLTEIEANPVDLLILDVMLPGISGFELCRRIRANEQLYSLPILMLSAMSDEEEISHGLAQGADDYVSKPFRFEMLLKRVENLLSTNSHASNLDTMTGLLSAKGVKLEVQRALNTRQTFQLVYVELLHATEFGRIVGEEERAKAIRHVARALQALGEQFHSEPFKVGHLGGGHFLVILPKGSADEYCEKVAKLWREHLPEFYNSIGKGSALAAAQSSRTTPRPFSVPVLDISFFVTSHEPAQSISFRELLDTLSRLRESSRRRGGGVYTDRRI
ncbi:MAG: response regulator [Candidatus Hydrogenedentes bacterium]|nr:response regulator [Candidatus Hydrogenedentota bacterium]